MALTLNTLICIVSKWRTVLALIPDQGMAANIACDADRIPLAWICKSISRQVINSGLIQNVAASFRLS